jgi:maltooligosyltrehalose synthase
MSHESRATYRIQLHAGFTLDDAAAITDYLAELGISHLYCHLICRRDVAVPIAMMSSIPNWSMTNWGG